MFNTFLYKHKRITILFVAFSGPPKIIRLYGKGNAICLASDGCNSFNVTQGTVYEFGTSIYKALNPPEKRRPGVALCCCGVGEKPRV